MTADGLEHTFALNHLAPFLLTSLLADRLIASAPSRVVTVSSHAQGMGKIDFDDLMGERSYSGQRAYNQSKLANVMFTYELARRFEGTGVTATALHPGITNTAFSAEDPTLGLLVAVMRPFMASPNRGADTPVYLASSPEAEGLTGQYFAKQKPKRSNPTSYDKATTARLWMVSADLVGLPDLTQRHHRDRALAPDRLAPGRGRNAGVDQAEVRSRSRPSRMRSSPNANSTSSSQPPRPPSWVTPRAISDT